MKKEFSKEVVKEIYRRCVEEPTNEFLKALFIGCVILPNLGSETIEQI